MGMKDSTVNNEVVERNNLNQAGNIMALTTLLTHNECDM